jgi:hypothetical protein
MKYCFTLFSVADLHKVEEAYGWFSFRNITSFDKNNEVRVIIDRSIVDVIYIYSQLLTSESDIWWIFSGNLYVTNHGLFSVNADWEYIRIEEDSELYIFRTWSISKLFYQFLKVFSKKAWNIDVIFPFEGACKDILLSKIHGITHYTDATTFINSIIPAIDKKEDIRYLAEFIWTSVHFNNKIIIKQDGYSGWNGIYILDKRDDDFLVRLSDIFISGAKDIIIMDLLETTDMEYRVYWVKENGKAKVLEIHGKVRIEGHILHNIAQWNKLIRLDKNILPKKFISDIEEYCTHLPELHGWLDVLTAKSGEHYFTENNAMTWYLYEAEEAYFAKDWLDAVASCYKN